MTDDGKTAELRRIAGDLERFVGTYCTRAPGEASDFADEKCQDAFLMLREALDNLQQRD